ncbi:hypothetical protein J2T57_001990 [Natronocella acetinitrilica]|uniref:Uncharacterized protein n=1 Tax=Natronocella acetinitrilica TaxID=414046 RepID=A0AAE3G3R3_9GAMM|nr:hypothetical protein [Natronocella acetinitrilica]MCP1674852.1 hypothetical protein [Natronocella acetinitrilica]
MSVRKMREAGLGLDMHRYGEQWRVLDGNAADAAVAMIFPVMVMGFHQAAAGVVAVSPVHVGRCVPEQAGHANDEYQQQGEESHSPRALLVLGWRVT